MMGIIVNDTNILYTRVYKTSTNVVVLHYDTLINEMCPSPVLERCTETLQRTKHTIKTIWQLLGSQNNTAQSNKITRGVQ